MNLCMSVYTSNIHKFIYNVYKDMYVLTYTHTQTYTHHTCVCVCVCVCILSVVSKLDTDQFGVLVTL